MTVNRVGDELADEIEKGAGFGIDVDGQVVSLLSLPPGVFGAIQERTGLRWLEVLNDPFGRMDIAADLVAAAYRKVGKPEPEEFEFGTMLRMLVRTPTDLPEPVDVQGNGERGADPTFASSTAG